MYMTSSKEKGAQRTSTDNTAVEEAFLALPSAPDFVSHPPMLSLAEHIRLWEKALPELNKDFMRRAEMHSPSKKPFKI